MPDINKPMDVPELGLRPPISQKVKLSEDMQQTLALVAGYCDNERKLVRVTQQGVLNTASAPIDDIFHVTADGDNDTYQGDDISCSEVMVMGHPDNNGRVWVRTYSTATVNNAWPLTAGDIVKFTINNLRQLQLLIASDTEKAIVAYTR